MNYEHGVFPVIILVDVSLDDELLIKRTVDDVHKALMREPVYRESGELSLVYYGDSIKIIPFIPIKEFMVADIPSDETGKADLGIALSKTIDWIYERKKLYKSYCITWRRPRVIVLSESKQLAIADRTTKYKIQSNIESKRFELMVFSYNHTNIALPEEYYTEKINHKVSILQANEENIFSELEHSLFVEYDGEDYVIDDSKRYYGKNNAVYLIGDLIEENGRSKYCSVIGNGEIIAKLFKIDSWKKENINKLERKMEAMLCLDVNPYIDNKPFLEWPLDILYDSYGNMQGIVSTRISKKSMLTLFDVQRCWRADANNPSTREVLALYPNYTWKYAVQIAYNLAGLVEYLHSLDVVLGAFHCNDFLIDSITGRIICIDCDRWGCLDNRTGEAFCGDLWMAEMMAPEWISRTSHEFDSVYPNKETDNFALAIQIFRLLMRNANPFGGRRIPYVSESYVGEEADIMNGNCPYVRECNLQKPVWAPDLEVLPVQIQSAFRRTFEYDAATATMSAQNRTTAKEWREVLYSIAAPEPNRNLRTCNKNKYHVYPVHNKECPWCDLEKF